MTAVSRSLPWLDHELPASILHEAVAAAWPAPPYTHAVADVFEEIAELAWRIRADLQAGATLDDVLGVLRTERHGPLKVMAALRRMCGLRFGTAKTLVADFCEGRSYAHLTLADLDLLGDAPRPGRGEHFPGDARDYAIIERRPWLLYARQAPGSVAAASARAPIATLPADGRHGGIYGASVSFEGVATSTRAAAAAWPHELVIERDEPDQMLVRFVRAALP